MTDTKPCNGRSSLPPRIMTLLERRAPAVALIMLLSLLPVWSLAQELRQEPLISEYFVQQRAQESLLIRIDGTEADFESMLFDPDRELIIASGVSGNRMAPLFQYVAAPSRARQLNIEIAAGSHTNRTSFDIQLNRVNVRDDRSSLLARGYQMLSFGLELTSTDTVANWSIKVNNLQNAARVFREFGMEELRLWSEYHAAFLSLAEMGDTNAALDQVRGVLTDAGAGRHRQIRLAAMMLEVRALASLRATGDLPAQDGPQDPLQAAAARAAHQAGTMGFQYERASALFLSGADLADRGDNRNSLDRFTEALDVADAIEAGDLATEIRESMVAIHGSQGDVTASSEVLQAIEDQLSSAGAGDELARNLLAQGRILNRTWRYAEAENVLREGLEHERNSVTRSQVMLELARAQFELGKTGPAIIQARNAIINPATSEFRRQSAALDVNLGLQLLASSYRAEGDFQRMREARQAQRGTTASGLDRDRYRYQEALDSLAAGNNSNAREQLAGLAGGANAYQMLASLRLCSLGHACAAQAQGYRDRLLALANRRQAAEARLLWARYLARSGNRAAALRMFDQLVDEVHFLQRAVPGLLGSWFWQSAGPAAREYLALLASGNQAQELLAGLAQSRFMLAAWQRPDARQSARYGLADGDSRALLERAVNGDADAASQARSELEKGRDQFRRDFEFLSVAGVRAWMSSLGEEEMLIDHLFLGNRGWVISADRSGARLDSLGTVNTNEFLDLGGALGSLAASELRGRLQRAGTSLLGPVATRLPSRVYWIGAGPLVNLPPAVLMRNNAFLGEDHEFVTLLAFPSVASPSSRLTYQVPERVFLAGRPEDYTGDYLSRIETSQEMRQVTDQFVGPGLTIVQGTALQRDELETDGFQQANLMHLAMPAQSLFQDPRASFLELSEPSRDTGRQSIGPELIQAWDITPGLVTMSQLTISGAQSSDLLNDPPLIFDFLSGGTQAVLASSWTVSDPEAAWFAARFYELAAWSGDMPSALAQAGREWAEQNPDNLNWARMRLYLE